MGRLRLGMLAVAVAAAACGKTATDPVEYDSAALTVQAGDTVRLRVGESARVAGAQVAVAFRAVVADSRCPIDALCVWAGDAEVRLDVAAGSAGWQPRLLHSFLEPRALEFAGYTFRLLEVAPPNVSTRQTQPGEYTIALEVVRR